MSFISKIKQLGFWLSFEKNVKPYKSFQESIPPAAPDYLNIAHWVAHPQKASKVHYTPEGTAPSKAWKDGEVDCFFIYPTLCFSKLHWNAPLDHVSTNELVEETIMTGQASVFNSCCRIFAPRYRQATFYSFPGMQKGGREALEIAYKDVLDAFNVYLENYNNGRPFFIAGHSQGSLLIMRLLEERIEGTPLAKQLVAAYPLGYWFPGDKFGATLNTIVPATSPTRLHSVVAYDTFLEGGGPMRKMDKGEISYSKNGQLEWKKRTDLVPLCVNPLNWSTYQTPAPDMQNKGAVHLHFAGNPPSWEEHLTEAKLGLNCTGLSKPYTAEVSAKVGNDNFLYVSKPKHDAFVAMSMPGGNMHVYDFGLFYMNLRENIQTRWAAYQKQYGK
jgi:Protein of unknown function (DUF3089)